MTCKGCFAALCLSASRYCISYEADGCRQRPALLSLEQLRSTYASPHQPTILLKPLGQLRTLNPLPLHVKSTSTACVPTLLQAMPPPC